MSQESPSTLSHAIQARYGGLASSCCSLSCGEALELSAPTRGEVFVDLGCGRGRDVVRAAGLVGTGGRAIGIDMTEEMLEAARKGVPPFLANVSFLRCDLAALELSDQSADVVISNCTINHAPDKAAVYREIHRALKPGGRFVVSDVIADKPLPESVRQDPGAWAACYGGAIPESEYRAAIEPAGFVGIEVLHRSAPYEKGGVLVRSLTVRGYRAAVANTRGGSR
ncbi:MAG: methyltransferase domain-containing protein [Deltaproteobacteria bacterium]|nr:methyltransferase domain-containing protein [Deltaproteobacteria bacterium]